MHILLDQGTEVLRTYFKDAHMCMDDIFKNILDTTL